MSTDIREHAARFYDLQQNPTADIPFYQSLVTPGTRVLELGCGTGRVLVPLTHACGHIHGIDASEAMLARCRQKLARTGLGPERARVTRGDITDFDLGARFDLILAPFRVFQNLETDAQVDGLFVGLRRHLAPGGSAVLTAFRPDRDAETLRATWAAPGEHVDGESALPGGRRLVRAHRRARLRADPLIVYPDLIYRTYAASGALEEEVVLTVPMRIWYPGEMEARVRRHGFSVTGRWGGYAGEPWGEGPELVLRFGEAAGGPP